MSVGNAISISILCVIAVKFLVMYCKQICSIFFSLTSKFASADEGSYVLGLSVCLPDYVMLVLPYSDEQLTLVLPRGGAWWGEINEA